MKNKNYDDTYLKRLLVLFKPIKDRSYALLQPQPTDLIVDVGCGTGDDAQSLAASGATVYGIDHDSELIALARQDAQAADASIKFVCGEANKIPLESNTVDKIRYDRIFQHLPNHEAVLTEAHRLLKADGIIQIVDTDYLSMTFFMDDINLERKIVDMVAYQRIPNSHNVRRLPRILAETGFDLMGIETQNFLIDAFSFANYVIHFEKMIRGAFENGNLSLQEYDAWQYYRDKPDGQFNLNLNLMLIMARKQNNSMSTKQVQQIGTHLTD